ncbi:MAG: hypothetical protein AMS21_01180 [Gemmatimonas sp. SG8_38_2]|nr:MAG: hypothetical protein AMS21_01180 [Gemmatimonas sp. SG8_38_2]
MRQVIEGLIYDTEKAEKIGYSSYSNSGDFRHYEETLYKTKNGNFFIAGGGGPMSSWGKPAGNNEIHGSTGIIALSEEEAIQWCEEHEIDADDIEEHFEVKEA